MELCKIELAARPDLLFDIDWLTEIIRRFSIAYLQKEPISNVNMKNPFRIPKVSLESDVFMSDIELLSVEKG